MKLMKVTQAVLQSPPESLQGRSQRQDRRWGFFWEKCGKRPKVTVFGERQMSEL